jgi:hypothetical protein
MKFIIEVSPSRAPERKKTTPEAARTIPFDDTKAMVAQGLKGPIRSRKSPYLLPMSGSLR